MNAAFVTASAVTDWKNALLTRGMCTDELDNLVMRPSVSANTYGQQVIELKDFVDFIENAGKIKNCSGLAWSVGLASNYAKRGKAGRAVLGAKTLGTAFDRLVKFYPLIQDSTDVSLSIKEDWTTLGYRILDPDIWPRNEDALYTLGLFSWFVKTAAPDAWSSVEISVEADSNIIKNDLSDVVQANVVYGAEKNSISFPTCLLQQEINLMPPVDRLCLNDLNRLLVEKRRNLSISVRAREMIFQGLSSGKVNQDHVATELGVSRRTLRRKLAAEGESFQSILDECRMRAASLEFRMSPNQSLSEMALKLGFSEHSTFSRAFMRWAGVAPQEFRKLM